MDTICFVSPTAYCNIYLIRSFLSENIKINFCLPDNCNFFPRHWKIKEDSEAISRQRHAGSHQEHHPGRGGRDEDRGIRGGGRNPTGQIHSHTHLYQLSLFSSTTRR